MNLDYLDWLSIAVGSVVKYDYDQDNIYGE